MLWREHICDDMPKKKDLSPVTELGKGPVITFMDRSFVADQRLVKLLVATAQRVGIPYQFKRAVAGGNGCRSASTCPAKVSPR